MKKITSNIQYRIEYKTVTLGGIPTLSKQEYLLTLFCAAFFLTLLTGYGHERGKCLRRQPNCPKPFVANLSHLHQYTKDQNGIHFHLARMISKCASEHLSRKCREAIVWYHLTATELCSSLSALKRKRNDIRIF